MGAGSMQKVLVVDAGGTSTRAALVDVSGVCLGYGTASGGNPTSVGYDAAVAAVAAAAAAAVAAAAQPSVFSSALVAMAGGSPSMPHDGIAERLSALGLRGELEVEGDLVAMFHSGTHRTSGCVLVAGTGCVAAWISDSRLRQLSDGTGWLLGDAGSGFWIGHRVARAVVASLDSRGPDTQLTGLLLKAMQLEAGPERLHDRPRVLLELVDKLYQLRPIELARFAPLAFQAPEDPIAAGILTSAASAMAETLSKVMAQQAEGPLVIGGSVAGAMLAAKPDIAGPLRKVLANIEVIHATDGIVGAAVLGLKRVGIRVDAEVFQNLQRTIAALRT